MIVDAQMDVENDASLDGMNQPDTKPALEWLGHGQMLKSQVNGGFLR